MTRVPSVARVLAAVVCLAGACGDDSTTRYDAGLADAGTDLCRGTPENARVLVACNGNPRGPVPPNDFGGTCQVDNPEDPRGTCDENLACFRGEASSSTGLCVGRCPSPPADATYLSTGGCPSGSRCFRIAGQHICFPDCTGPADCSTGACDREGSCSVRGGSPPSDAGTEGGTDGEVADADMDAMAGADADTDAETDAPANMDAGSAADASADGAADDAMTRRDRP